MAFSWFHRLYVQEALVSGHMADEGGEGGRKVILQWKNKASVINGKGWNFLSQP